MGTLQSNNLWLQVTVYGDGKQEMKVFSGDKLNDKEQMIGCASELEVPDAIKNTRQALGKAVFDLEEKGQTALGPALLLSVMLASRHPASKVIVCTDGMANIGLGSLDTSSDEDAAAATNYYTDIADLAKAKGWVCFSHLATVKLLILGWPIFYTGPCKQYIYMYWI